ncbi:MAG TPA: YciI-like protein [Balneolaceae bacterium]|nr:YciI-like protein [Balneolaceae bacterium]
MHYLLIYDLSADYLEKRAAHRDEHLELAWEAENSGDLVLGGALQDPADQAYLLFSGDSPDSAVEFAKNDPYVKNGIVKSWKVRPWMTVVGDKASKKVYPGGQ